MTGRMLGGIACVAVLCMAPVVGNAGTIVVNASDNIYYAGQGSAGGGGTLPGSIAVSGDTSVQFTSVLGSMTCGSPAGCITINGGGNLNDADGAGAAPASSYNTGLGSVSGITAPGAGYLVGLFVGAGGPSGSAPAALDFTTGAGTGFTTLSPLLDQTFFIGDGLTGDGTGTAQTFYVPTGATALYLGISDACSYGGPPTGCYSDNSGTFTASYTTAADVPAVPEPATLAILGTALAGIALGRRRRA